MERLSSLKSHLVLFVTLVLVIGLTPQEIEPAVITAYAKNATNVANETRHCRTNGVCGWEVYNDSARNLQYYVPSSCECIAEETCIRKNDSVFIAVFEYRCAPADPLRITKNATNNN